MADRVFGNHEKAQRWLRKPSRALNQVPIDLLQSEARCHACGRRTQPHRLRHSRLSHAATRNTQPATSHREIEAIGRRYADRELIP
ncbi:antitoxin Xre/MbcA/ParS toxin-binding domain-containing protein [Mesorhizobium prunaredense]|uniref:antitoxin Xre/MbcA/ParS toxin-binding domain-containing protein n=1 Tax=Mesorhizobium prunaredense TaxID=1631249 RepID=UPI000984F890